MMFGSAGSQQTAGSQFKAFMALSNPEKDPDVFATQLTSVVNVIPAYEELGYSIADLEGVSKALLAKGARVHPSY